MPADTPAVIAARNLTKPQREAFRRSTEIGLVAANQQQCNAFINRGFAQRIRFGSLIMDWTPLGTAVRAHLEKEGGQ